MDTNINEIKYAPGIVTYGAQGERGERGKDGYGLYYLPYELDDKNKQYIINNFILKNRYISNIPNKAVEMIDRKYQENDLFISPTGILYQYNNGTLIERCTFSFEYFESNGNSLFIKEQKNLVLGDSSSNDNYDSNLNIIGTNKGIAFYNSDETDAKVRMSLDASRNFVIDSSIPVNINNLFVKYDDISTPEGYNKLIFSNIVEDISISVIDSSISIENNTNNIYTILMYSNNNNRLSISAQTLSKELLKNKIEINISDDSIFMITAQNTNSYASKILWENKQ